MLGLDFSAAFNRAILKLSYSSLDSIGFGGLFLSILTIFLSNKLQRVIVNGQFNDYRGVVSGVLCFPYCIPIICGLG